MDTKPLTELIEQAPSRTEVSTSAIAGAVVDKKGAEEILAVQGGRVSSKLFKEALLAGDLIKIIAYIHQTLRKAYLYRFLGPESANESMKEFNEVITPLIQDELQKKIKHHNPGTLLALGTMAEAVVKVGGYLKLRTLCAELERFKLRSDMDVLKVCSDCGIKTEDIKRVAEGKKPECPLTIAGTEIFGDMRELQRPNTFRTILPFPPDWYYKVADDFKKTVREWRAIDFTWFTQLDRLIEQEEWRNNDIIGRMVLERIHKPVLDASFKILKI